MKLPIYELCAKEDHIAPAKSVFIGLASCSAGRSLTCCRAPATSPASSIRRTRPSTSIGPTTRSRATLEAWLEGAEEHPGSWWPHYAEWLAKYSGDWIEARQPGSVLGAIEDAPGSYVKAKH